MQNNFVLIRNGKTHGYYPSLEVAMEHGHTHAAKGKDSIQIAQVVGVITYEPKTEFVALGTESVVEAQVTDSDEPNQYSNWAFVVTTHRGTGKYRIVNNKMVQWMLEYKDELYDYGELDSPDVAENVEDAITLIKYAYMGAERGDTK